MHYYKRNIGDYHKKAGRLSILQHGAYTLLIDACYDREVFPTMEDAIDWVWASSEAEVDAVKFVLKKFFIEDGGVYIQSRIQEDLDKYHANALTNKRIAIEREKKKKQTKGKVGSTKREQTVNEKVNSSNEAPPNQEPLTKNQEPLTKNQLSNTSAKANNDILEVFNYWKEVMKKNNSSILNAKRTKALKDRFKEGYTVEQIKMAIVGCSMTPHNMGQNNNGKKYDDLELICRDGVQVERFANNAQQQAPERYGQHVSKTLDALNNMEWDDD
tara:strand:+ start:1212 stop:2027 length:816 start_codon:yes stop_codon:yes gene_type:complete